MVSVTLALFLYCLRAPSKSIAELGFEHCPPERHSPFLLAMGLTRTEMLYRAVPCIHSAQSCGYRVLLHAQQTLDHS